MALAICGYCGEYIRAPGGAAVVALRQHKATKHRREMAREARARRADRGVPTVYPSAGAPHPVTKP